MGRTAGAPNKNKGRLLRMIQEEFPNYNPLIELVRLAHAEESTTGERITCHKEVAQYVNPKLKAVEVTQSESSAPVSHEITFTQIDCKID